MKRYLLVSILVSWGCWAMTSARADITIEMKQDNEPQQLYVAEHALRGGTEEAGMIFRGDRKILWVLQTKEKKYTEITEQDAKAMGEKVNEAMSQMQEAMKNMPPEQREMVQKMMAGKMPMGATSKRTLATLGQNRTINGFACAGYTVTSDDGSVVEIWTADAKSLNLDFKDLAVLKEMADFMKTMVPGVDSFKELIKDYEHPREDEPPGFPVLTIHKDKSGKEKSRSELVKIDKGSIPAAQFELPAGFKKEKLPSMD